MNKFTSYILISILIGAGMVLFLFLSGSAEPGNEAKTRPEIPALTVSAPIPSHVKFCDREISLERLDMRERFDREINGFTYLHSTTLLYIKRANRFFPVIEPVLKRYNIPDDFKYLCVIESGLDTRAISPVKAAGLWQFMESTAKMYGLEIRDGVDERYHIEKATEAACRYFRDAYNRYGKWEDVAASYNAGMGKISGEMNKQQVESAFDLLLVPETSRYIFRIMAAKEVFSKPEKYGFILKKEDLYPAVPVDMVDVQTDITDLASFAQKYGLNYRQLKEFNVWLRDTQLTIPRNSNKVYQIAIPKKEYLYFKKDHIKVHDPAWVVD
jgi:hypothetical protein